MADEAKNTRKHHDWSEELKQILNELEAEHATRRETKVREIENDTDTGTIGETYNRNERTRYWASRLQCFQDDHTSYRFQDDRNWSSRLIWFRDR